MEQLLETAQLLAHVERVAMWVPKHRLQDAWCRVLLGQPGARRYLPKQRVLPFHSAQVSLDKKQAGLGQPPKCLMKIWRALRR